jgi:putative ABC transport system substrate-binding protein
MTRRRCFNAALLAWMLPGEGARAQPAARPMRIGYLADASPSSAETRVPVETFRAEMQRLGWTEGSDLDYAYCFADGNPNRFAGFMRELVALRVDLIAAMTTDAALAAQEATSIIPIVFIAARPIENGLVASLRHPGGNLTGVDALVDLLLNRRLQLLAQAVPGLTRIAFLTRDDSGAVARAQAAAGSLGLELVVARIDSPDELQPTPASAPAQADAWLVDDVALSKPHRRRIVESAAAQRLPAMYASLRWVHDGGLLAYAADESDMLQRAAAHADRILRGARPGELPIDEPSRFVLGVNLGTAQKIGIKIADSLLLQASEVIE